MVGPGCRAPTCSDATRGHPRLDEPSVESAEAPVPEEVPDKEEIPGEGEIPTGDEPVEKNDDEKKESE